jgi:hypothetical protein
MNNSLLQLNETIKLIDLRNKFKNLTSIVNNFKNDGFKNKKFHLIKTKQQLDISNLNGNYEVEMCFRIAFLIFSMVLYILNFIANNNSNNNNLFS